MFGNKRPINYKDIVQELILSCKVMGYNMLIKINFLFSDFDFSLSTWKQFQMNTEYGFVKRLPRLRKRIAIYAMGRCLLITVKHNWRRRLKEKIYTLSRHKDILCSGLNLSLFYTLSVMITIKLST